LKISHPFVNKIGRELKKAGLVMEVSDKSDKRKRIIMLNEKGHELVKQLQPVWNDIQLTIREILIKQNNDLFEQIRQFEQSLSEDGLYDNYYRRIRERQFEEIKIHTNNPDHFPYFKSLNIEWLEAYFKVEEKDTYLLDNPQQIIDNGGYIFTAELNGQILGTCSLIQYKKNRYELGKMGVTEAARGLQIGKKLGETAVKKAKKLKAKELVLESNNSLKPALNLYKQLGFNFLKKSPFGKPSVSRADVFMSYDLK
ncbi:MAG: bifunctional helix-turn-helix transcriptional regulator/GNAT family N-acetyltransferase, partial [Calditrichaeota bacterium]|nr:bifunctional helix-turn-helix transcriptional regulator/GNAT family N-acetyltransferase [Calditrichota bacterium]